MNHNIGKEFEEVQVLGFEDNSAGEVIFGSVVAAGEDLRIKSI